MFEYFTLPIRPKIEYGIDDMLSDDEIRIISNDNYDGMKDKIFKYGYSNLLVKNNFKPLRYLKEIEDKKSMTGYLFQVTIEAVKRCDSSEGFWSRTNKERNVYIQTRMLAMYQAWSKNEALTGVKGKEYGMGVVKVVSEIVYVDSFGQECDNVEFCDPENDFESMGDNYFQSNPKGAYQTTELDEDYQPRIVNLNNHHNNTANMYKVTFTHECKWDKHIVKKKYNFTYDGNKFTRRSKPAIGNTKGKEIEQVIREKLAKGIKLTDRERNWKREHAKLFV